MTVGKQDNPSDEVQEESASEPLDPTVDVAKAAPAAAKTPDGEAEEAGKWLHESGEVGVQTLFTALCDGMDLKESMAL